METRKGFGGKIFTDQAVEIVERKGLIKKGKTSFGQMAMVRGSGGKKVNIDPCLSCRHDVRNECEGPVAIHDKQGQLSVIVPERLDGTQGFCDRVLEATLAKGGANVDMERTKSAVAEASAEAQA